ncbi:MAG TPA: hypothetical protein PLX54_04050 [Candidatus Fermentibacter daniensis]|nr:hypothetical protein [Candidatus Fermentibacter daniensis]HOR07602.1 hypothetical protein [Candidatus Fermentibacter daniensis]HPK51524.1 hypothetical protein [Candidatus Fermentibacter daniensis]HQE56658.1 hypothetical protein [Candidatus Fermentibacter daniensis]HQH92262.1 hypothetical protein [Candidatus Fermentibacter daniensis]
MNYSSNRRWFPVLLVLAVALFATGAGARNLRTVPIPMDGTDARPSPAVLLHNLSNVWSIVYNVFLYGDYSETYPSMQWPGGSSNNYLWSGDLWSCAYGDIVQTPGDPAKYASCAQGAQSYELWCSEGTTSGKLSPGPTGLEETFYTADDWYSVRNENPYGLQIYTENYTWGTPGYNQFMVNNLIFTHHSEYGQPGVPLNAFVAGVRGDCDVSDADVTENHIDDLVFYDGHAIWCNDPDATFEYRFDDGTPASSADFYTYQQNPDGNPVDPEDNIFYYYNYLGSDGLVDADVDGNGVSDHFTILAKVHGADTIYAEEPNTGLLLFSDGMPQNYFKHTVNDTTYLVVPRNLCYMWDSDNPSSSSDDTGELSNIPVCNGFIGWRLLDCWIKKADGTIQRPSDVMGVPIPLSHSWWNWESDPGTDEEIYNFLWGNNPDGSGRVSGPAFLSDWVGNPAAPEAFAPENPGPWPVVDDNPRNQGYPVFDYRFLMGIGPVDLADGDSLHVIGGWIVGRGLDGLRAAADNLLDAYYRGGEGEPGGWGVPSLPPTPILFYEAQDGNVHLEWGANAEVFDPFGGYRIYRARFAPQNWELVVDIPGAGTYSYDDSEVTNGFPYYYVVCAYDAETDIEGTRSNYKQTLEGTPLAVVPSWNSSADWKNQVAVVPNPYRGSCSWEQTYFDKIAFVNLPTMCDIYIYTLAGDHVITLEHRGWGGNEGTEFWDLVSRNQQEVVSGLYFYRIETEDDYLIGKFAIIK